MTCSTCPAPAALTIRYAELGKKERQVRPFCKRCYPQVMLGLVVGGGVDVRTINQVVPRRVKP